MRFDKNCMFADALAHDGTPTAVDLKTTAAGPGKALTVNVIGNSLAGATGIMVDHGTTSSPTTDLMEIDVSSANLNDGFSFKLPSKISRYVVVSLVGTTSAGAWTAGLSLDDGQTSL